jgi:hypothetical protein
MRLFNNSQETPHNFSGTAIDPFCLSKQHFKVLDLAVGAV